MTSCSFKRTFLYLACTGGRNFCVCSNLLMFFVLAVFAFWCFYAATFLMNHWTIYDFQSSGGISLLNYSAFLCPGLPFGMGSSDFYCKTWNALPEILGFKCWLIGVEINFFRFNAAPHIVRKHAVSPRVICIDADTNAVVLQKIDEGFTDTVWVWCIESKALNQKCLGGVIDGTNWRIRT